MNDGDFLVDILDDSGNIVSKKLRKNIVKGRDIYHAVYCILFTPSGNICLNLIAERQDMPNLHAGKHGFTAATIKRSNESASEAANRAVKHELRLNLTPTLLHEQMLAVDGTFRKVGIYKIIAEKPTDFNHEDIEAIVELSKTDFTEKLHSEPQAFSPLIVRFFKKII